MSYEMKKNLNELYAQVGKDLTQELQLNPIALDGFVFEQLAKCCEKAIVEVNGFCRCNKIQSPIRDKVYFIAYNLDKVSTRAGMLYLSKWFWERGCRLFLMQDTLVVNTSMSECEMRKIFDELLSKMPSDNGYFRALAFVVNEGT